MTRWLAFAVMLHAGAAFGAYPEAVPKDQLSEIKEQIEAGQAAQALEALTPLVKDETFEADVLNLMGYAYRKMGQFAESRDHYTRALRIDPRHKGALEYMGELELQTGDPIAARALLVRLREVCPAGCEELQDLEEAFVEYGVPARVD